MTPVNIDTQQRTISPSYTPNTKHPPKDIPATKLSVLIPNLFLVLPSTYGTLVVVSSGRVDPLVLAVLAVLIRRHTILRSCRETLLNHVLSFPVNYDCS